MFFSIHFIVRQNKVPDFMINFENFQSSIPYWINLFNRIKLPVWLLSPKDCLNIIVSTYWNFLEANAEYQEYTSTRKVLNHKLWIKTREFKFFLVVMGVLFEVIFKKIKETDQFIETPKEQLLLSYYNHLILALINENLPQLITKKLEEDIKINLSKYDNSIKTLRNDQITGKYKKKGDSFQEVLKYFSSKGNILFKNSCIEEENKKKLYMLIDEIFMNETQILMKPHFIEFSNVFYENTHSINLQNVDSPPRMKLSKIKDIIFDLLTIGGKEAQDSKIIAQKIIKETKKQIAELNKKLRISYSENSPNSISLPEFLKILEKTLQSIYSTSNGVSNQVFNPSLMKSGLQNIKETFFNIKQQKSNIFTAIQLISQITKVVKSNSGVS